MIHFDDKMTGGEMSDELYKRLYQHRILYYNGEISDMTIDYLALPILALNEEEKDIPTENLKPITIWLNSYGGNSDVALYLIDIIKNSRIPIHVKVLAMAASAGLYITLACHKRTASKNSIFLLHKGSYSLGGNASEVEDVMEFYKGQVDERFVNLILETTKITKEELKKIRRSELYVFADDAKDTYGFIDSIT
jgi:ATP-dependent Clp protease protease subunit